MDSRAANSQGMAVGNSCKNPAKFCGFFFPSGPAVLADEAQLPQLPASEILGGQHLHCSRQLYTQISASIDRRILLNV